MAKTLITLPSVGSGAQRQVNGYERRVELALFVLILLLAAVLRMGWAGISEFKRDEALLSQMALDMIHGHSFPLHGITSSVGVPNSAISVYLFALPYALSSNPMIATLFVGLLNVLAVALTGGLARRYLGAWPALLAALLYAASPWGVFYARKVWAQDLLPPFVLLLVITGLRGFVESATRGAWRYQVAHLVILALTVQIHVAAVSLVPLTLAFILIGRRRIDRRVWMGGALAVLTLLPFAAAALRGGWLRSIGGVLGSGAPSLLPQTTAFEYALRLIGGAGIHALTGARAFRAYLDAVPDLWPLLWAEGVLSLAAALWLLVSGLRGRSPVRWVFGLWVALPILTFTVPWTPVYPHYLIALLPAAYIALAAGAKAFADRWRRHVAWMLGFAALLLVVGQAYLTLALLSFVDTHDVRAAFGMPLHDLLALRDTAVKMAGDAGILVYSSGDDPEHDETPAVWRFLLYDAPDVRFVGADTSVYTAGPMLWLTVPDRGPQPTLARWEAPQPPGGGHRIGRRLANGVTLAAWRFGAGGFSLDWQPDGPADRPYSLFVHLLDADGARVAQADVQAWRGPWRAGDVVVTRFTLGEDVSVPSGGTWRVGMYYFLDDVGDVAPRGVDVLDAAGNPAGVWVDVPAGDG